MKQAEKEIKRLSEVANKWQQLYHGSLDKFGDAFRLQPVGDQHPAKLALNNARRDRHMCDDQYPVEVGR